MQCACRELCSLQVVGAALANTDIGGSVGCAAAVRAGVDALAAATRAPDAATRHVARARLWRRRIVLSYCPDLVEPWSPTAQASWNCLLGSWLRCALGAGPLNRPGPQREHTRQAAMQP